MDKLKLVSNYMPIGCRPQAIEKQGGQKWL